MMIFINTEIFTTQQLYNKTPTNDIIKRNRLSEQWMKHIALFNLHDFAQVVILVAAILILSPYFKEIEFDNKQTTALINGRKKSSPDLAAKYTSHYLKN